MDPRRAAVSLFIFAAVVAGLGGIAAAQDDPYGTTTTTTAPTTSAPTTSVCEDCGPTQQTASSSTTSTSMIIDYASPLTPTTSLVVGTCPECGTPAVKNGTPQSVNSLPGARIDTVTG